MEDKYSVLDFALSESKNWLDNLDNARVFSPTTWEDLTKKLGGTLPELGTNAQEVVEHLVKFSKEGLLGNAGGRFFAWVIGGALPSALASDWLVSCWDQNAALYACSPSTSVIEEIAGKWILELLDLPKQSSFAFTTGCQLAHFTCLSAARHRVLKDLDWDVSEDGLFGAPKINILASEHRHGSVDRAIRYLGFGNKSLHKMNTTKNGEISQIEFEKCLKKLSGPKIVILNAADLNIAAFDRFSELIPITKKYKAWVHIDGAFGLFARASEKTKPLTNGIELADSWATDAHKWLNVPFDCGIAIVNDKESHQSAMTIQASYIEANKSARDEIDWNPEWSRRARGVPVYAALKELGKKGVSDLIERCCEYCKLLVAQIEELPNVEIVWKPTLNQGLIRFLDPDGTKDSQHDEYTQKVIEKINLSGEAFFSPAKWNNKTVMRISVVNWQTNEKDIERTANIIKKILENTTN